MSIISKTKDQIETLELSSRYLTDENLSGLSMCSQLEHLRLPFPTKVDIQCLNSLAKLPFLTQLQIGSSHVEPKRFIR